MDSPLLVALVALIAVSSILQTVVMVAFALAARRLAERLENAETALAEMRRRLERTSAAIDNVAELTAAHLPRVVGRIEDILDRLQDATRLVGAVLLKPLLPLGTAIAVWKGLKRGTEVYRRLRAPNPASQ